MQDFLVAILLGCIEGFTEFLPISSTGHLILFGNFLDFNNAEFQKLFNVIIQSGAIMALIFFYRQTLITKILQFFHLEKEGLIFAVQILCAFIPSVVLGVIFHDFVKAHLFTNIVVILSLFIGGVIILLLEQYRKKPTIMDVSFIPIKKCFTIGLCQTIAFIPGVSRSGSTIITAMLLGVSKKSAIEFSFFLSIPTMIGASVYDFLRSGDCINDISNGYALVAVGFLSSFVFALIAVKFLLKTVSEISFKIFGYYRIALSLTIFITLLIFSS